MTDTDEEQYGSNGVCHLMNEGTGKEKQCHKIDHNLLTARDTVKKIGKSPGNHPGEKEQY